MATKCQFGSWPAQSLVSFLVSSSFCKWSWLGKIPQAKIGKACNTAGSVDGVDRGRGLVSKCRVLITESHITSYHITSLSHRNAFSRSNLLHTDGFYADMTIVVQKRLKARCRHLCIILGVRHHCRSLHQSRFQHRCQKDSKGCDLLTPWTANLGTCGASLETTCERSWLGSHSRVRWWRRQRWETGSKCGAISETEICFSVLLLRYQSRPHVPSKGHKWKHISCITDSTRIHNHESWSIM